MANSNNSSSLGGCAVLLLPIAGIALAIAAAALAAGAVIIGSILGLPIVGAFFWAMWIPIRVLRGASVVTPAVASPDEVRAGNVMGAAPNGDTAALGWDRAWPNYFPFQFEKELRAMKEEARHSIAHVESMLVGESEPGGWRNNLAIAGTFVYGVVVRTSTWIVVTALKIIARIYMMFQNLYAGRLKKQEQKERAAIHAEIHCPACYREISIPAYKCPVCGEQHNDLAPGNLGLHERICQCGTVLPIGVKNAAHKLEAFCPYCSYELSAGSGTRRLARVPVFGPPLVGKSLFLHSTVGKLERGDAAGVMVQPLSDHSKRFIDTSREFVADQRTINQTPVDLKEPAISLLATTASEQIEIHFMDAAGEKFTSIDTAADLTYLDSAKTLILVVDPLSIADINIQISSEAKTKYRPAAKSANDAYGAVVDRLLNSSTDLNTRHLAVVVSKADAINELFPNHPISGSSSQVREWLMDNGADELVRRAEIDFGQNVTYFAIDSVNHERGISEFDPLNVIEWIIECSGSTLGLSRPEDHTP